MKSHFLLLILFLITASFYGQVKFEKGYFINNENQRIDSYIKNYTGKERLPKLNTGLAKKGVLAKRTIDSIKKFGITGGTKFIRADVKIDRSSNEITSLTKRRNPIWSDEQLF